ncbi:MAG: hypothetical protein HN742_04810 [Lentisphaerae bacterium]|jgi:hypothetical protein|nr:hypothetical protein [Lentisphaerota bacterium]MBT4817759.1 hypothetical protein [Lentisphaerota bacterium]MBT5610862.1 hypothetical protein [Lentisphaerota bacterium]MBT7053706.1 hypothetical protein [Lentisphaerota bacterium]MBT7841167.1 hypothetical protein [Lentisphaerota bacterium]
MKDVIISAALLVAGTMSAATLEVEGESYSNVGGPSKIRLVDRPSASGGKVVSYWEEPGVWLEWEFNVPDTGNYAISIRYACAHPESFRRVEVDGEMPSPSCKRMRFAGSGSWATHAVATLCDERGAPLVMPFAAGQHRLRMSNVDSVGLAVDVIYVHDPGRAFTDVALSESEAAEIADRVRKAPDRSAVSNGDVLALGDVRVVFGPETEHWAWASNTSFDVPPQSAAKIWSARTRNIVAQLRRVGDLYELYATDGHALYVVAAASEPRSHRLPLWPRAYAEGTTLRELVLWRTAERVVCVREDKLVESATAWRLGGAQLTGSVAIGPAGKALVFDEPVRVAAAKFCPPTWSEAGLEVSVEADGQTDTLRSSAFDYPALGAFYGYGRFQIEFTWGKGLDRCVLTDLATKERVVLVSE